MITEYKVAQWLGSDNTLSQALEVIALVANGEYTIEELKKDIATYAEE